MKYIINENNTCGQASLTEKQRATILEQLGFTTPQAEDQIAESVEAVEQEEVEVQKEEAPALYEWDDSVFVLDDEVFEVDGELFLRASELDNETSMELDESHKDLFVNEVSFEEDKYGLGDIFDYGGDIYIKLNEKLDKGTENRIAKIAARDKERQAAGKPAPKGAPKINIPGQSDDSNVTDKEVTAATRGAKPASKKSSIAAAAAHGDAEEN